MTYFAYEVYNERTGEIVDCDTGFLSPDHARKEGEKRIKHNNFMTGDRYVCKIIVEQ